MAEAHSIPTPADPPIRDLDTLKWYLQTAIKLEHATLPPYLTALYSIRDSAQKSNLAAVRIINEVAREEMLHMTLAANLLNAVGGEPNLLAPDFVPAYPAHLPSGAGDFEVPLQRFSIRTVEEGFLKIERPAEPPQSAGMENAPTIKERGVSFIRHEDLEPGRKSGRGLVPHVVVQDGAGGELILHYWSIGDFYQAIKNGFEYLAGQMGAGLFVGTGDRQVGKEHYHSGGGEIIKVYDLSTALKAIDFISGQGEGSGGQIYDASGEISHYYRFKQIPMGQYYRDKTDGKPGDTPDKPTGEPLHVHEDQVFPIRANAKIADYPIGSELRQRALAFNASYAAMLAEVHRAFNSEPGILVSAIVRMRALGEAARDLMAFRIPGEPDHAAPTFEMNETM